MLNRVINRRHFQAAKQRNPDSMHQLVTQMIRANLELDLLQQYLELIDSVDFSFDSDGNTAMMLSVARAKLLAPEQLAITKALLFPGVNDVNFPPRRECSDNVGCSGCDELGNGSK